MTIYLVIDPRQSGVFGDMLLAALTGFFQFANEVNNQFR